MSRARSKIKEANNVAATSVRQVPAIFRSIPWQDGTRNADVGGGKYDEGTNLLRQSGVTNLIYDPFSRPDTYEAVGEELLRHPADTGTLANVLNVIEESENRLGVLQDAIHFVKPGGKVYVGIYEGNRSGVGAGTKTGSWQNNRALKTYLEEVKQVFPDAKVVKGLIVGTVPKGLAGLAGYEPQYGNLTDLETQLREEVKRVVRQVTADTYPAIYARLRDVAGYQQVEDAIINYVLHNHVTPGAALGQLESTWGEI